MGRISKWLKPGGLLFVHIFVSKALPYHFEVCWDEQYLVSPIHLCMPMCTACILTHYCATL